MAKEVAEKTYEVLKHSPFDALTAFEQEFLLRWFLHNMPMSLRFMLMEDHPVIYNKLCGREIMTVYKRQ